MDLIGKHGFFDSPDRVREEDDGVPEIPAIQDSPAITARTPLRASPSAGHVEVSFHDPQPTPTMAIPATRHGERVEISPSVGSPLRAKAGSRQGTRGRARAFTIDSAPRYRPDVDTMSMIDIPRERTPDGRAGDTEHDTSSDEDEETWRLYSSLGHATAAIGTNSDRRPQRRPSFRAGRTRTTVDSKSGLMRIGQRRKSFPNRPTPDLAALRSEFAQSRSLSPAKTSADGSEPKRPNADLNRASIHHAHLFLDQLLDNYDLPRYWHDILIQPLMQCVENIDLDIRGGDSIDIRQYVKLKRIAGGKRSDTQYLCGTVFSGMLSLKRMRDTVAHPRVLVIQFPIEYRRADDRFMSLDAAIAQEREYIKKLVSRIVAFGPSVIISDKPISGLALQLLADAGVSAVTNVKDTVLNRVARYTQADVLSSIDRLAMNPRLGHCSLFQIKTFRHKNVAKTFVFLSGIPKELGCTIVLRGSSMDTLQHVKGVVEFMVYVIFNLRLETSLMRDQFVSIPPEDTTPTLVDHSEKSSEQGDDDAETTVAKVDFFNDFTREQMGKILSSSPFVKFGMPYLLREAQKLEDWLVSVTNEDQELDTMDDSQLATRLTSLGVHSDVQIPGGMETLRRMIQSIYAIRLDGLHEMWTAKKKQWEVAYSQFPYMFSPSTHQSITVLYTIVSNETRAPCVGPEHMTIDYYGENDKTIGQFVEGLCQSAEDGCPDDCGLPMLNHFLSYVHNKGRVTIVVERFQCKLPGLEETILMWSYCKQCKMTMPVLPMSPTSWEYSLGKYLELYFYSTPLPLRASMCKHNIYRDHIRYFGYKNLAVRLEFDDVDLLEIVTPRPKMAWRTDKVVGYKVDAYKGVLRRIGDFWSSVEDRLDRVKIQRLNPEKQEECRSRITELRLRIEEERNAALADVQSIYENTKVTEFLPLNCIVRGVQELVVGWEAEFVDFEARFFPSEKDISRITTQHLKKIFFDETPSEEKTPELSQMKPSELEKVEKAVGSVINRLEDKPAVDSMSEKVADVAGPAGSDQQKGQLNDSSISGLVETPVQRDKMENTRTADGTTQSTNGEPSEFARPTRPTASRRQSETAVSQSSPAKSEVPAPAANGLPVSMPVTPLEEANKQLHLKKEGGAALLPPSAQRPNNLLESAINTGSQTKSGGSVRARPALERLPSDWTAGGPMDSSGFRSKLDRFARPMESSRMQYGDRELAKLRRGESPSKARVATLAKHFEQISKEFERARARERDQLELGRYRAFPVAVSKPIVDVFKNVEEAVEEVSDEETSSDEEETSAEVETATEVASIEDKSATQVPDKVQNDSSRETASSSLSELPAPSTLDTTDTSLSKPEIAPSLANEKQSLVQTLANFWADRSATGWGPLQYPLTPSEHMFSDSDIIIREDEPSSLIAFCLSSKDYLDRINDLKLKDDAHKSGANKGESDLEKRMLKKTALHLRYQFQESSARLSCKVFYSEQFDAIRKFCGCDEYYIQSLSRCAKWNSSGGKSGSAFLKTLDDRLVIKELSPIELEAFVKFAPSYFEYMAEAFFHELPTVLVKILGLYSVQIRNPLTGNVVKLDLIVMENLFYNRKMDRIFDLKGSMRNRHVQQTGRENEVLLDENMVEYIYESPLFTRDHAKRFLKTSLFNDTLFLAKMNVMDYSLVIGVDKERRQLIVGIIGECRRVFIYFAQSILTADFIRTFTWDKKLESWVKERRLRSGVKEPTVISPKQYKIRFREAMDRYILMVPE